MISCEEEAQKAVCATIRPILEFVDSEYFNCHRHGFTTSEAHHICSHLAKTFANRRQADMMVILKRTQELGAFQTILALLLDIAPFVGSLSPAELEADWDNGQPSVWFSLVSSFGLMTLEILEAKKLLPSLYDEIKVHYQRSGLELINILLNSKNLFERVDGRIGKVLMDIRSQLFRFMPHRVFEDATDSLPPDLRQPYYEAGFAFFWRLRYSCTVPGDPLLSLRKGTFDSASACLYDTMHDMIRLSPTSLAGAIPRLTGHSYKELIDQCFTVIQYPLGFGVTPNKEWCLLAMVVVGDRHNDVIQVLTSHYFITRSAEQASTNISEFCGQPNGPSKDAALWFLDIINAWTSYAAAVIRKAHLTELVQASNEVSDSGLLFVLEAWQSSEACEILAQEVDVSYMISDLLPNIVELCVSAYKQSNGMNKLRDVARHLHIIRQRSDSKPFISDKIKKEWAKAGSCPEEFLGEELPERICGLPGCTSQRPAKLQCARCKKQYYCSQKCQKPDWRLHKKYCAKAD